jgi:hypothetical protein
MGDEVKRLKIGNAVVCEYIAEGARNRHTLVNVFSGDFVVEEFPAKFHIAVFIEIEPSDEAINNLIFEVKRNGKTIGKLTGEEAIEPASKAAITSPQMPLEFAKASELSIVAQADGYSKTTVLRKKVLLKSSTSV